MSDARLEPPTVDATRRDFLKVAAATGIAVGALGFPAILEGAEPLSLPPLPWSETALEPVISSKTLSFHWGKHHRGYVDALNGLVKGGPLEGQPLEKIVRASAADSSQKAVFNNAAQAWNHTFYWKSLRPKGGAKPAGDLAAEDRGFLREVRGAAEGPDRRRDGPVRKRLGLARGRGRVPQGREDRERRHTPHGGTRRRSSSSTSGSTPTTSTTRTAGRTTSRPSSTTC